MVNLFTISLFQLELAPRLVSITSIGDLLGTGSIARILFFVVAL